jgi:hypothetical protein
MRSASSVSRTGMPAAGLTVPPELRERLPVTLVWFARWRNVWRILAYVMVAGLLGMGTNAWIFLLGPITASFLCMGALLVIGYNPYLTTAASSAEMGSLDLYDPEAAKLAEALRGSEARKVLLREALGGSLVLTVALLLSAMWRGASLDWKFDVVGVLEGAVLGALFLSIVYMNSLLAWALRNWETISASFGSDWLGSDASEEPPSEAANPPQP